MKKSRRARKDRRRTKSARSGARRPTTAPAPTVVLVEEEPPVGPTAEEYRYVVQDLKRVAVLAAAMFAMLIVLSFFIH